MLLMDLEKSLTERGVRHNITSTSLPQSVHAMERIERLSYLRNTAMMPMYDEVRSGLHGRPFSKVLWINDILFDTSTLATH